MRQRAASIFPGSSRQPLLRCLTCCCLLQTPPVQKRGCSSKHQQRDLVLCWGQKGSVPRTPLCPAWSPAVSHNQAAAKLFHFFFFIFFSSSFVFWSEARGPKGKLPRQIQIHVGCDKFAGVFLEVWSPEGTRVIDRQIYSWQMMEERSVCTPAVTFSSFPTCWGNPCLLFKNKVQI